MWNLCHRHCTSSKSSCKSSITSTNRTSKTQSKMSAMRATSLLRVTRTSVARSMTMPVQRNISNMIVKPSFVGRQLSRSNAMMKVPSFQTRAYAASSGLSNQEIQNRIFEVLKSFEKVDPSKVCT